MNGSAFVCLVGRNCLTSFNLVGRLKVQCGLDNGPPHQFLPANVAEPLRKNKSPQKKGGAIFFALPGCIARQASAFFASGGGVESYLPSLFFKNKMTGMSFWWWLCLILMADMLLGCTVMAYITTPFLG